MYLTAQRVRDRGGHQDVQTFLHLHDVQGGGGFPSDPLTVPQQHPGHIVRAQRALQYGGNEVLAYLDIIAPDAFWSGATSGWKGTSTEWWQRKLEPFPELMAHEPVPWVIEAGDVHVIFNTNPTLSVVPEYEKLLASALSLWESWRAERKMR